MILSFFGPGIRFSRGEVVVKLLTWRIILVSKWLISMVSKSPKFLGLWDPFHSWPISGGDPNHLNHPHGSPGDEARFFAFATTVAAKAYGSDRECEGDIFFFFSSGVISFGTHFGDTNLW